MPIRTAFALGPALALGLALPAAAQDASTVVATVNGTDITLGHMIALKTQLPQQYREAPDEVLFDLVLEQLIRQSAMADTIDDTPRTVELRLDNERRALLAQEVVKDTVGEVDEAALESAYQEAIADFEGGTEFNAAHILVETEEEAQALVEEARSGADFGELARENSTGPSGPNGGALGWFGPGMMVPTFDAAVQEMEVGEIAGPVETQFGWHVIKLNEMRETAPPSMEELRPDLEAALQEQAVAEVIEEMTAEAEITRPDLSDLDRSLLSNVELLDQ